jgi:hypothetical protein
MLTAADLVVLAVDDNVVVDTAVRLPPLSLSAVRTAVKTEVIVVPARNSLPPALVRLKALEISALPNTSLTTISGKLNVAQLTVF